MVRNRKEIVVFISSPGDCETERQAVREVLTELNKTVARSKGFFFQDIGWEELSPGLGTNPQAVIDEQLGDYNILLGIMWMRFGTPIPGGAQSGTEHEINLAIESWERVGEPRVMFYFNESPPSNPYDIDINQFSKVKDFREKLQMRGLTASFQGTDEFRKKLRGHLHNLLDYLHKPVPKTSTTTSNLPESPYHGFNDKFRDIISPIYYDNAQSYLHLIFGSIADIRETTVVLPVGQDFDFWQRGPRSVLASFENIRIEDEFFFTTLGNLWPEKDRPRAAGLGTSRFLKLPKNGNNLHGVMFTVTTRDISAHPAHRGLYVNTPIEGIDHTLEQLLHVAESKNVKSIAIPLLGAGYANIRRTCNHANLKQLVEEAILCISIQKLEARLKEPSSCLERGFIVVYSQTPHSKKENQIWELSTKYVRGNSAKRAKIVENLLAEIENS